MANTTNFNWETPDDTDLVKDGAAAIRTLGSAIDTSLVDLKGGTTGQVLSKATNTDMDFTWVAQDDSNAIQNALVDAKGDIVAASAVDTPARLPVGTDNQRLIAASGETTGLKYVSDTQNTVVDAEGDLLVGDSADTLQRLAVGTTGQVLTVDTTVDGKIKWATAGGSGYSPDMFRVYKNGNQALTAGTWTKITSWTEDWDIGADFATPTWTCPTTGYYSFDFSCYMTTSAAPSSDSRFFISIYKNGAAEHYFLIDNTTETTVQGSATLYLTANDTIELYTYSDLASTNIHGGSTYSIWSGQFIRS
jgi:hypothetical protein